MHGREMADSLTKFAEGLRAVPGQNDAAELYAADTLTELVEFQTRYFDAFRDMHMQLTSGIINFVNGVLDASRSSRSELKKIERHKVNQDALQKKFDKEGGSSNPSGSKMRSLKDQIDGTKNEVYTLSAKTYQDIARTNRDCVNFGGLFFTAFYSGLATLADESRELLEDAQALNSEFLRRTGQVSDDVDDDAKNDVTNNEDENGDVTHDERDVALLEMIEEERKNWGRLESILKYKTRIGDDMRDKDRGLSADEFEAIFMNIHEMIALHKEVLAGLEDLRSLKAREVTPRVTSLYDATAERFRKAYRPFVERSGIAQWTLERARRRKGSFGQYFGRLAQQTVVFGIYPLEQLLGMPARHIRKVAQMLHRMLGATPAVDPGWLELYDLSERYDAIAEEVLRGKEDGDHAKELTAIQEKLTGCETGDIAEVGRVHLHTDSFVVAEYVPSPTVIRAPTSLVPTYFVPGQTLYGFLFNDSIVFAVRTSNALVSLAHETFLFITKYSVADLELSQPAENTLRFAFTTSGEAVTVTCRTAEQRDAWAAKVAACLAAWHKTQTFGVPPEEIMARPQELPNFVPAFVHDAVAFVEAHGLASEGIFRISGSKKTVETLKFQINVGRSAAYPDPFTAAVLLKQWLLSLPQPLMGAEFTDAWVAAGREDSRSVQIASFCALLKELPSPSRRVLYYVMKVAHEVAQNAKDTKMSPQNLAIVLSPSILWSPADPNLMAKTSEARLNVVKLLIEYFDDVFAETAAEEKAFVMEREKAEIARREARKEDVERLRKEQMEAQANDKREVVSAEEYARRKAQEREEAERRRIEEEKEAEHRKREDDLRKQVEDMKAQMEAEKKRHELEEAERVRKEEAKKKYKK